MQRRTFLKSLAAAPAACLAWPPRAEAALPKAKITRVRIYRPPNLNQLFNQSNMVATVETDAGITGIGEGGAKDTLEQCAGTLIGKDPFKIEAIWQEAYLAWFYPPGREKLHALGALDLALWDIKGKAMGVPVHQLLGGPVRNYCETYNTGNVRPPAGPGGAQPTLKDRVKATLDAGYKLYRVGAADTREGSVYDTRERVRQLVRDAKEIREACGPNGEWSVDFHQRFEFNDALRGCKMIEEYDPYLVEDPVRDEHFQEDIPKLRQQTRVPLAAGEEWGWRWDMNRLVESHDIDYNRCTLPNVGGITEMIKVMALCDTHAVGIVPHFTGPVATAALVHCLATFPGTVLFEYNYGERPIDYLPEYVDFKSGKLYPNDRPGLGVTLELKPLTMIGEVTQPGRRSIYTRPDGSLTHW
ncbi:MAG: mandelate racemase/muconate lactonizing enzyme family protein [Acidobacteriia bacterium]|nr:mandelate racemase/muconate lactonizing enzyme family protein [Terriglobia bacterium]